MGITTAFLAWAANLSFFAAIPATVVGYASTFAYLLQTPDKFSNAVLLSFSLGNPLIVMSISFLLAAAFGIVSLFIAKKMIAAPITT